MASTLISTEPATGAEIWSGEVGDAATEVAAARAAAGAWAAHSLSYRSEAVRRFANVVRKRDADFAKLIARETGKPLWEARTKSSLSSQGPDFARRLPGTHAPAELEAALGNKIAVRHKPTGCGSPSSALQFPAPCPTGTSCGADRRQCRGLQAVGKDPSTGAFLSIASMKRDRRRGGPPADRGPMKGARSPPSRVSPASLFTRLGARRPALHRGFAEVPQKILALGLAAITALVCGTPPTSSAAAIVVQSAILSGQRCTAARRLIVKDGEEGPLLTVIRRLTDRLIVGEPFAEPQPFMGPIIDNAAADHLQEQWLGLMMKGGKPIRRLDRPHAGLPFLTPAIIDVTDAPDRPDEELFGPVLQLIRVKDFDAAIDEANNTRFGLAASLVGGSPELYDRFWANVRGGVITEQSTNGAPSNRLSAASCVGQHRRAPSTARDYCAYPVTSSEVSLARASIDQGLADPDMLED